MSGTTTRLGLPYPGGGDGPDGADVPYWMQALADALDGAAIDDQGVFASRPVSTGGTPGIKGRYYMVKGDGDATKNGILWRDNGTGWDRVGIAGLTAEDVEDAADKDSTSAQTFAGGVLSANPTEGIGYATGAGGTVSQGGSEVDVTINHPTGRISVWKRTYTAGTTYAFTVISSAVAANDVPVVAWAANGEFPNIEVWTSEVDAGSFRVNFKPNVDYLSARAQLKLSFAVIKGVAS